MALDAGGEAGSTRAVDMRILLLTTSYAPMLGGLQTVTHRLAQHLLSNGHEVLAVTNRYPRTLPCRETLDGVPIRRLFFLRPSRQGIRRPHLFLASLLLYPTALRQLEQLVREFRPAVINFHYPTYISGAVLWLMRRHQFRLVVSLHGGDVMSLGTQPKTQQHEYETLMQAADRVTACSNYLLAAAAQHTPVIHSKGSVIYNGVDLGRFAKRACYMHGRPYLLSFGRLIHLKGYDILIDAFAAIAGRHPEVDVIIAGEGEERARLTAQVNAHGLENRVHFYGRADARQLVQLINGCEFCAFTGRMEAFSIAALEAMAGGKAVIATRVGGLPEILPEPPNRLVAPSAEAVSQALDAWLGTRDLIRRAGAQNIQHAARFDWRIQLANYEAALTAL